MLPQPTTLSGRDRPGNALNTSHSQHEAHIDDMCLPQGKTRGLRGPYGPSRTAAGTAQPHSHSANRSLRTDEGAVTQRACCAVVSNTCTTTLCTWVCTSVCSSHGRDVVAGVTHTTCTCASTANRVISKEGLVVPTGPWGGTAPPRQGTPSGPAGGKLPSRSPPSPPRA